MTLAWHLTFARADRGPLFTDDLTEDRALRAIQRLAAGRGLLLTSMGWITATS